MRSSWDASAMKRRSRFSMRSLLVDHQVEDLGQLAGLGAGVVDLDAPGAGRPTTIARAVAATSLIGRRPKQDDPPAGQAEGAETGDRHGEARPRSGGCSSRRCRPATRPRAAGRRASGRRARPPASARCPARPSRRRRSRRRRAGHAVAAIGGTHVPTAPSGSSGRAPSASAGSAIDPAGAVGVDAGDVQLAEHAPARVAGPPVAGTTPGDVGQRVGDQGVELAALRVGDGAHHGEPADGHHRRP